MRSDITSPIAVRGNRGDDAIDEMLDARLDADVEAAGVTTLQIKTPWQIVRSSGATVESIAPNISQVTFDTSAGVT